MTERDKLVNLQSEKFNLETEFYIAKKNSDFERITFLKSREQALPNELYAQKILAVQEEIKELEAETEADVRAMQDARKEKERIDLELVPKVNALKAEIEKLNTEAWSLLSKPDVIQARIQARGKRIDALKAELKGL